MKRLPTTEIRVRFARKPLDLSDVLAARDHDDVPCKIEIQKTKRLSPQEYDSFAGTLLKSRRWLNGLGGHVDASTRKVVEVRAAQRPTLYIDPQGGDYGRYVGMAID